MSIKNTYPRFHTDDTLEGLRQRALRARDARTPDRYTARDRHIIYVYEKANNFFFDVNHAETWKQREAREAHERRHPPKLGPGF